MYGVGVLLSSTHHNVSLEARLISLNFIPEVLDVESTATTVTVHLDIDVERGNSKQEDWALFHMHTTKYLQNGLPLEAL